MRRDNEISNTWLHSGPKGIRTQGPRINNLTTDSRMNSKPLNLSEQVKEKTLGATWLRRG
jgi:hypothetical protein